MVGIREIRKEIDRLKTLVGKVSPEITLLGEKISILSNQISELRIKADRKASEFKRLYEDAEETYENGDKEEAKNIAERGHSKEFDCRYLNSQIKSLCSEHKKLCRLHKTAIVFAKSARLNIRFLSEKTKKIDVIFVSGFKEEFLIREALDKLPIFIANKIRSIKGMHKGAITKVSSGSERVGRIKFVRGKYNIYCAEDPTFGLEENRKEFLWNNFFHEAGHVFWRSILHENERNDWESIYINNPGWIPSEYAKRSTRSEEDFCETFMLLMLGKEIRGERKGLMKNIKNRVENDVYMNTYINMGLQLPDDLEFLDDA
ncbi:MAG: hypothetical protein WCX99_00910 [Candidatus Paceibacterota bacterium]